MVSVATTPRGAAAMSEQDIFELDRSGYLLIKGLLTVAESERLAAAIDRLESDAHSRLGEAAGPVPSSSFFKDRGYHALVNAGRGADAGHPGRGRRHHPRHQRAAGRELVRRFGACAERGF